MTMTTLVQLGLLWGFATKLAGSSPEETVEESLPKVLNIFQISDDSESSDAPAPRSAADVATRAAAPAPDVDASTETELPPPEWAIVRLPAQAPRRTVEGAPARSQDAGSAGAGVYDPFAGAAPMRREDAEAAAQRGSDFTLDRQRLSELVRRATLMLRSAHGTIELLVAVSAAGIVVEARAVGGTASTEAKAALGRAMLGQPLFHPPQFQPRAQSLRLPPINLG